MTTNVPHDVLEDAVAAGFVYFDKHGTIQSVDSNDLAKKLVAFAELRAQRQQGAEPDGYFYEALSGTSGYFFGPVKDNTKRQVEHNDMKLTPFWLAARPTLDFAAGMMNAAEICLAETRGTSETWAQSASHCRQRILAAIPADAEAQGVDELSRYERIGLAASCCRTIRFQEGGPVYDAAGGIMDSHEPEAEVRSGSGQMFRAETIADALLKMYEAEFVDPDADKPSSDKGEGGK
jgi:hypothetical protein